MGSRFTLCRTYLWVGAGVSNSDEGLGEGQRGGQVLRPQSDSCCSAPTECYHMGMRLPRGDEATSARPSGFLREDKVSDFFYIYLKD